MLVGNRSQQAVNSRLPGVDAGFLSRGYRVEMSGTGADSRRYSEALFAIFQELEAKLCLHCATAAVARQVGTILLYGLPPDFSFLFCFFSL